MDITIRKIEKEDIPKVVKIQINAWKEAYKNIIDSNYLESMSTEDKIRKRKNDYNTNGFIVATISDDIVGFCRYVDNNKFSLDIIESDCELLALYVDPKIKRSGVGSKLFEYVKNEFKSNNKKTMLVWCLKENLDARKFYTKMGGKILHERMFKIGNKEYPEVGFIYEL